MNTHTEIGRIERLNYVIVPEKVVLDNSPGHVRSVLPLSENWQIRLADDDCLLVFGCDVWRDT